MDEYVVIFCAVDSRFVVQDSAGLVHVIRVINRPPAMGARLFGGSPHMGFDVMLCMASDAMYRVVFESINQALGDASTQLTKQPDQSLLDAGRQIHTHFSSNTAGL
jgi:hypothetical protein